jgi:hypothetical protein
MAPEFNPSPLQGDDGIEVSETQRLKTCESCDEYVSRCFLVDEEDPMFAINWKEDALVRFIAAAAGIAIPIPNWVSLVSAIQFKQSFITHLASFGSGGTWGEILCGPNTLMQYTAMCVKLGEIQVSPWFQATAAAAVLAAPVASVPLLADFAAVTDRTLARGTPMNLVAPAAPAVQLFR